MERFSEGNLSMTQDSEKSLIPVTSVKKEEPEDERLDAAIAIFDDVDGDTTDEESGAVDADHVGFFEHNGVNCWVCPGFRIPQIPQVSVVKRPLKDLCDAIKTGDIILDPDYQRDVVWDDTRCEGLLVSLLMGYLPPPIIFNVKLQIIETANGKLKKYIRTCVDGKQRLTSILRFMRGEIGFQDSKHKKWYYQPPASNGKRINSTLSILPEDMKKFFLSRFFICYEYNELSQSTEEEMFQLVQRGIALTPAEKMRAMSSEWATLARKYEDDYSLILNLSKQGRASGFRLTLTIFAMVQEMMSSRRRSGSVPTLQASPQALTRMLEEKEPINPALKENLKVIFDRYESLVKLSSTRITTTRYRVNANSAFDPAPNFLRGDGFDHVRTFSPLELITSVLLVCYHLAVRTDAQLLDDVKEMRRHLRLKHKDLRVNAQCWTTAWEFIVRIKNSHGASREDGAAVDSETTRSKHSALHEAEKKSKRAGIPLFHRSRGEMGNIKTEAERVPSGNELQNHAIDGSSGTDTVSILGQSKASLDANGGSKLARRAKAGDDDIPDTGSGNMDKNSSTKPSRSSRSSILAHSDAITTMVGMSSSVTTGLYEPLSAMHGMSQRKSALRVDTKIHKIGDASDSGDSLSTVPSSTLNSPGSSEVPDYSEPSRKRSLDWGNNDAQGVREAKKSRH